MFDYLIAHQQIVFVWMFGGFCGFFLSIAIDNNILNLYEARSEEQPTAIGVVIKGIKFSLLSGLLSAIFVLIDYWLSFAPLAIAYQSIFQDSLISEFTWSFICAMSNTIMVVCQRAISSQNQN